MAPLAHDRDDLDRALVRSVWSGVVMARKHDNRRRINRLEKRIDRIEIVMGFVGIVLIIVAVVLGWS